MIIDGLTLSHAIYTMLCPNDSEPSEPIEPPTTPSRPITAVSIASPVRMTARIDTNPLVGK